MASQSSDRTVQQILASARQRMSIARQAQRDFNEGGERRLAGLQNAITVGRSVTWAVQGLRGAVDEFDAWYEPIQRELKDDAVCRWFVEVRNRIEKQGTHGEHSSGTYIAHLNTDDLRRQQPPGTKSTFIGDQLGRSGWVIGMPDGTEQTVYFRLPETVGRSWLNMNDAPDGRSVDALLEYWLSKLETVVDRACAEFGE